MFLLHIQAKKKRERERNKKVSSSTKFDNRSDLSELWWHSVKGLCKPSSVKNTSFLSLLMILMIIMTYGGERRLSQTPCLSQSSPCKVCTFAHDILSAGITSPRFCLWKPCSSPEHQGQLQSGIECDTSRCIAAKVKRKQQSGFPGQGSDIWEREAAAPPVLGEKRGWDVALPNNFHKFTFMLLLSCSVCNPMNCSTPGFPVLYHPQGLLKFMPNEQWCHPTLSSSVVPFSSCLHSFPTSGSFLMSWFFTSGGQSIGASLSASVLPMNIQGWFQY